MPPNVAVAIELSEQERLQLEAWTRRRTSAQALALRSRIVLAAAEGLKNTEIAERLEINRAMAAKWRSRFAEQRLDGLTDEPRPGRPRTITDEQVDAVITTTLESTPKRRHALVDAVDGRGGRAHADGGVADLAGVRAPTAPPGHLQAHPATRCSSTRSTTSSGSISTRPSGRSCSASMRSPRSRRWTAPRRSCRCSRASPSAPPTTTAAPARRASTPRWTSPRGKVIGAPAQPPPRDRVQAVPGHHRPRGSRRSRRSTSCSTTAAPTRRRRSRSGCSRTPASSCTSRPPSSSWLNLVERWFGELTTKLLKRGTHRSVAALNADIRAWIQTWNDDPRPYVWTKTADQILDSIRRYCDRINDSRH